MSLTLELKKIKRTGFFPAFLAGGIIAGAFPIINTAARPEMFTSMSGSAAEILMSANYETIAMLNLLLLTAGACILYHIEYAGNGIQKMQTLPVSESGLFFGKAFLLVPSFFLMLCIEGTAMFFCGIHWFGESVRASAIAGSGFPTLFWICFPAHPAGSASAPAVLLSVQKHVGHAGDRHPVHLSCHHAAG